MNKLLTTIIMFCLPVASYAEIFSCSSNQGFTDSGQRNQGGTFIVDTERGMRTRRAMDEEGYFGSCQVHHVPSSTSRGEPVTQYFCTADNDSEKHQMATMWIIKYVNETTFTAAFLGAFEAIYGGNCEEI